MSKAVNSPTARLLQSSRLFSLPRPLPAPDLSSSSSGTFRASETATTPYPTHQSIATPASALHRGDWGLKRSLPGKKLKGTKPTVRIRAQDTWEHVTTFESAGDHVRTLEKWNEMGIPMIVKQPGDYATPSKPVSVYDDAYDATDRSTAVRQPGQRRWKYDGPWLGGMQEGEFRSWLLRQVGARQGEWQEFLRKQETERRVRQARAQARDEGNALSREDESRLYVEKQPTDAELRDLHKELRDEHEVERGSSRLTALLTDFLDLPNITEQKQMGPKEQFSQNLQVNAGLATERGPPVTHPGAGLSHIRTNAIMENHPIYGPQAARTPVQARVVRPRTRAGATDSQRAKLGLGGIVADDTVSRTTAGQDRSQHRTPDSGDPTQMFNKDTVGGGKIWVRPDAAWVDENGKIRMSLSRVNAHDEGLAVKMGDTSAIEAAKDGASAAPPPGKAFLAQAKYGTSLPRGHAAPSPRVKGFDDELGSGTASQFENLLQSRSAPRR